MTANEAASEIQSAVDSAIRRHLGRFLDSHGGAVSTAAVSPAGDVVVKFHGACRACPAVAATFYGKVAPIIRQVDGVRSVSAPNVNVSAAAVDRIRALGVTSGRPGKRTIPGPIATPGAARQPIQVHATTKDARGR